MCLFGTFFVSESPRFLIKAERPDDAHKVLAQLRNLPPDHPYVASELADIRNAYIAEKEATRGGESWRSYFQEMFMKPDNLYIILVAMAAQMFAFWSGSQTITVYAPDFFSILGKKSQDTKLVLTALLGTTKVVSGFVCALFLVEAIGRKRSLGIGILLQTISTLYIATYLSIVGDDVTTPSRKHAGTGAIFMIFLGGTGFALGWNPMVYWVNSETLPLRIRAISSSLIMGFHYLNQYAINRASPLMLQSRSDNGLGPAGTFWFYLAMLLLGGFFSWFFIPETLGMELEKTEALFRMKWYQIGRYGYDNVEKNRTSSPENVSERGAVESSEVFNAKVDAVVAERPH